MVIDDLRYRNDELLKNDLRLLPKIINERVCIEIELLNKLQKIKNNNQSQADKFKKRYQGPYILKIDYYNTRICSLCNSIEVLSERELEYIYDMLIYPISIKTIIRKYKITSESGCYRYLDKIIKRMIEKEVKK